MKKRYLLLAAFLISGTFCLHAQEPIHINIPLNSTMLVKSIPDDPFQAVVVNIEAPDHFSNPDKKWLFDQKKKVSETYPKKREATFNPDKSPESTPPEPVINKGFMGNPYASSVPLDNYLAVSNSNRLMSVSNVRINTFNTTNDSLTKNVLLQTFCSSTGLGGFSNHKYDPKVVYDPLADRFIAVILNGSTSASSKVIVAFSVSNDPDSTWNFYLLPGNPFNDTTWLDYPSVSVTKDEIFITGNQVKDNISWQIGFSQTVIWQIRKNDGYNGNTLTTQLWNNVEHNGRKIRNLHPVKGGSDIYGPNQYFLSNRNFDIENDTIFLLEVTDTIGAPGAQLNVAVILADQKYGVPPDADQVNGEFLATNDGRVLSGIIENDKIYFASNSRDTSNGRAGIYFGVIHDINAGNYVLNAQMISSDTLDLGYPKIGWVGSGLTQEQLIISFDHSAENTFAGISSVFYEEGQFSNILRVKQGDGYLKVLQGNVERWGDYFGTQPVFNRDGRVWICGTYGNSVNRHTTWIAQLDNPYGIQTTVKEQPAFTKSHLYPNPAVELMNVDFIMANGGEVLAEIYDINGRNMGTVYKGGAKKGQNLLTFNILHLPAGNYILKISGKEAQTSLKFIKN